MGQLPRFVRLAVCAALAAALTVPCALPAAADDDGGFAATADALIRLFTEPFSPAHQPAPDSEERATPVRREGHPRPSSVEARSAPRRRLATRVPPHDVRPAPAGALPAVSQPAAARPSAPRPVAKGNPDRSRAPSHASGVQARAAAPRVVALGKDARAPQRRPQRKQLEVGIDAQGNPAVSSICGSGWIDSCGGSSHQR